MFFIISVVVALVVAASMVQTFTGESILGQFDYLAASIVGILIFVILSIFLGISSNSLLLFMTGGIVGCSAYHFYKEHH